MAVYPETDPTPDYPLIVTPVWSTVIADLPNGKEQRRANWLFPKYDVTVNYDFIEGTAEVNTLWAFYNARRGAYEQFYIYELSCNQSATAFMHHNTYCGTADGVLDTFDLPGRHTSSQTVYINGMADGTVSILVGGGAAGSDRVEFLSPPPEGAIITADFLGHLRMNVRFAEDRLSRDLFAYNLYHFGSIQLRGVGPL